MDGKKLLMFQSVSWKGLTPKQIWALVTGQARTLSGYSYEEVWILVQGMFRGAGEGLGLDYIWEWGV